MKESNFKKIVFIIFFICSVLATHGQTRAQLEQKKKQTEKEIALTKKILEQTGRQKSDNLHALNVLRNLIKARERLIYTLNKQVDNVSEELVQQKETLFQLENQLANEKNNYAKLLKNTYKTKGQYHEFNYIFSSSNLTQGLTRIKFLNRINNEQQRLLKSIDEKTKEIQARIELLEKLKTEKENLLLERVGEREKLEIDKSEKDKIVQTLSGKEKELKQKLQRQQKAFNDLDNQIKKAIAKEMEEARKRREKEEAERRRKAAENKTPPIAETPQENLLSNEFWGNKRKLPWPVERGFVSQKFGQFAHPTLAGIYIENNGIDIAVEQGAQARSVFRGEVSAIFSVPGMGTAVLVNHGDYYTVYARLSEVFVKQGQSIQVKEPIGKILSDENGKTELHFEVWKNQEKQNPEHWLSTR